MPKLIDIKELAAETGLPERTLRTLRSSRKIPFTKLGWKTIRYSSEKVAEALSRLEVKAVS